MSDVRVILQEDIGKLGEVGEVVSVKPGYARNFLVPAGKAMLATESNVKALEHQKRVIGEKLAKKLKDVRAVADGIRGTVLEVEANAGSEGKLFGSVTGLQIADLLAEKGFDIDRRKIALPEPIRSVGEFKVAIKIHREVETEVTVVVRGIGTPPEPEGTNETDQTDEEEPVFGHPDFEDEE